MSLPFLNPSKMASTILMKQKPDASIEVEGEEGEMDAGLKSAAEDLISAVHSKDAEAVAMALQNAMSMCNGGEV